MGPVRRLGGIVLVIAAAAVIAATPGVTVAHEEIASSDPPSGAVLDEPISKVTIDFGEPIADNIEMALLHYLGNAEIERIPGIATKVSETVGVLEFDELTETGRYFVRYLVTVPTDGDALAGAVRFDYGRPAGSGTNWSIWLVFGVFAVVVLSVGVWLSLRPPATDDATGEVDIVSR